VASFNTDFNSAYFRILKKLLPNSKIRHLIEVVVQLFVGRVDAELK
jgi:hypothetical protein